MIQQVGRLVPGLYSTVQGRVGTIIQVETRTRILDRLEEEDKPHLLTNHEEFSSNYWIDKYACMFIDEAITNG